MSQKTTSKYTSKTVKFGAQTITLYSLDGATWSTRRDELSAIKERQEASKVTAAQLKGEVATDGKPAEAVEAEEEKETPEAGDGPVEITAQADPEVDLDEDSEDEDDDADEELKTKKTSSSKGDDDSEDEVEDEDEESSGKTTKGGTRLKVAPTNTKNSKAKVSAPAAKKAVKKAPEKKPAGKSKKNKAA